MTNYRYNKVTITPDNAVKILTAYRNSSFEDWDKIIYNTKQLLDRYPPCNIYKNGDKCKIELAVAGFSKDELEVTIENSKLIIIGKKQEQENDQEFGDMTLQQIAFRPFTKSFELAKYLEVVNVTLENGILTIFMEYNIPEEKKPRLIPIESK